MVPEGGGVINCTCSCCSREISYLVHIWVSFVINSFGIFRVLNGRNVAKVCYLGGNFNLCWCTSILKKINSGFFFYLSFLSGAGLGLVSILVNIIDKWTWTKSQYTVLIYIVLEIVPMVVLDVEYPVYVVVFRYMYFGLIVVIL